MSALIKPFTQDQARGMLIGLAVGDALGASVQRMRRGSFEPIQDMVGGGPHQLKPGQWTDETAMAMCLAQMLRSANGWDPEDAMRRLTNWEDHGYLSSTRQCFDLSYQVGQALEKFQVTGNPYSGTDDEAQSGHGAITRLAPVAIAYGGRAESAVATARLQARLTHASSACQRAASVMAEALVAGDMAGFPPMPEAPAEVTSQALPVLQAAAWALRQGATFEEVVLAAVNLGGHADAAGAVAGQLAGCVYGYDAIPQAWRDVLHDHDKILKAADDLYAMRPVDV